MTVLVGSPSEKAMEHRQADTEVLPNLLAFELPGRARSCYHCSSERFAFWTRQVNARDV